MPERKTLNEDLFYKGSSANLPRLRTYENKVPFWDFNQFAVTHYIYIYIYIYIICVFVCVFVYLPNYLSLTLLSRFVLIYLSHFVSLYLLIIYTYVYVCGSIFICSGSMYYSLLIYIIALSIYLSNSFHMFKDNLIIF